MPLREVDFRRPVHLLMHRDKHRTPTMRAFGALVATVTERAPAPA